MWRNNIRCKSMFLLPLKNLAPEGLTHCNLVTPYGATDQGQHWPDDTEQFPEPMLTYYQWGLVTISWEQFHKRYPNHQLLKLASKLLRQSFSIGTISFTDDTGEGPMKTSSVPCYGLMKYTLSDRWCQTDETKSSWDRLLTSPQIPSNLPGANVLSQLEPLIYWDV